jgi:Zn-dependent metalloprotease
MFNTRLLYASLAILLCLSVSFGAQAEQSHYLTGEAAARIQKALRSGPYADAIRRIQGIASGGVDVVTSPVTTHARFLRLDPGNFIPHRNHSANAELKARSFLDSYRNLFVAPDLNSRFAATRTIESDDVGMGHVRFRQEVDGVPVSHGEVIVHMTADGVTAVNAHLLPTDQEIDTVPTIDAQVALDVARQAVVDTYDLVDFSLTDPRLEIFSESLLGEPKLGDPRLAWFIEASGLTLREFLWVDAHTAEVLHQFSQLTDAMYRQTFDSQHTNNFGVLRRSEGQGNISDIDIDSAHDFAGDTYDYFFNQHGRDSFDNAGATMDSHVRVCFPGYSCPLINAFWTGAQVGYGDGMAVDDVVAHEWTHAVTEFSAGLVYQNQSGALNESFSDIFGEVVDLTNLSGNDDSTVRWDMGEDLPIGAIRDMENPNQFSDPSSVTDYGFYECGTRDNGGVHINSGVPNHAFALMVDGGSFNGFNISGIGLTKAARVEYRALTNYLTSGSTFQDAYSAIVQSCQDLIGNGGITNDNCTQVEKALNAVEMNVTPCAGLPGLATLASPSATTSSDATPTYTWQAVSNAAWYQLWVDDSSTQGKIERWYQASEANCAGGSGTCSVTPATTLANGAVDWWIQTWNSNGYGPWSARRSFTVAANDNGVLPPAAATLVSPSGSIGTKTPIYTWNAVANATWYYLWVNDATGNRIRTWYRASEANCASGSGSCSVAPSTALAEGAGRWWVQTWNPNGYGPWSAGKPFTVSLPGPATLASPSGTTSDNTPTYSWNAVPLATWYYLWVNDSTGNRIQKWYRASDVNCAGGSGTCSVTPGTALAQGAGRSWVQTWNPVGYGPWSAAKPYTVQSSIALN